MFRQFSRTFVTGANSKFVTPSYKSRAFEFGAQAASIGAQITLFVYLNHKPEVAADTHKEEQNNQPTNLRY